MKNRNLLIAALLAILLCSNQPASDAYAKVSVCSQKQKTTVVNHITKQINAITKNDWKSAYNLSSASFRKAVSIDIFTQTIKSQYVFLIFNDGLGFGSCLSSKESISQIVTVDYRGVKRTLSYGLSIVNKRLGVDSANEIVTPRGSNA